VVVVSGTATAALTAAEQAARAAHAPLLLAAQSSPQAIAALAASAKALRPVAVLTEGLPAAEAKALAKRLPGVKFVGRAAALPATRVPALTATAEAAGAAVVGVAGTDPRADPAAVTTLARLRPDAVVAVGAQFGPAARLAGRISVAQTGRQLPGGGQVLFPGRRLVAMYGHPGTPGLGVLGQQDLAASITRARHLAAEY